MRGKPMKKEIETLLEGAIDMHVHAAPDISLEHPQHRSNEDVIEQCRKSKMGGIVLKTHGWPSIRLAQTLDAMHEDFRVFPSVTLNKMSGGPHPWVVEMAIAMGAKMIWLPTWSAKNDRLHPGFNGIAPKYLPLTKDWTDADLYEMVDENGNLTEEIKMCIQLCKEADVVLGTGHISAEESWEVGKYAHEIGYKKLVLTHPCNKSAHNTLEQIKAFAELGYAVEICTLNLAPLHTVLTIPELKHLIEEVGADHCFLSTDHFFDWTPSIPDQLYQALGCLLDVGVSYETLERMMKVPRTLLEE